MPGRLTEYIRKTITIVLLFVMFAPISVGANKKFTLVIDAGHGGKDIGAPGTYSKEKDINLRVALAFGRYVEQSCPDVSVVYTRKTDVFVPLYERAEIANRVKADLFISVHTNAVKGASTVRGFETYTLGDGRSHATKTNLDVAKRENSVILLEKDYQQHYAGFDPNSPESNIMFEFIQDRNLTRSIDFAKMLQKNVCKMANRPDKGVHQQNLAVLRLTSMPACLIELGFITTSDEERLLNDATQSDLMSKGIFNAFAEYKNKYDKGFVVPFKTDSAPIKSNSDADDEEKTPETRSGAMTNDDVPADQPATVTRKATTAAVAKTLTAQKDSTKKASQAAVSKATDKSKPVFKIQILVSRKALSAGNASFKGLTGCEKYEEDGLVKYTYGASNNYNEIYRLRSEVVEKFPGAFIIAFKDGKKMDVNQAIREFKQNRNK
jgi:N-acetylmuramoyl-L-alanine amidase